MTSSPESKVVIEGIFRTMSPLHISAPDNGLRYNPKTRKTAYGTKEGQACTPMRTLTILATPHVQPNEHNSLGTIDVPVLPANGLRGRLRRMAAAEIEDVLRDRDEKMTWQAYQMLHCGAVTARPDGSTPGLEDFRAQRNNIMMGVFGGGPRLIPGRLRVSTGMPVVDALCAMGIVPDVYQDLAIHSANVWRLTEYMPVIRVDDMLQFADPRAHQVIDSYPEVMAQKISEEAEKRRKRAEAEAKRKADKKNGGAGANEEPEEQEERGLRTFAYVQAVITGVPFYVRFDLHGSDEQIGLLLSAIMRLLQGEKGIGGKSAVGFGRFGHDLTMTVDGEKCAPFTGQGENTTLNLKEDMVDRFASAFETAAEKTVQSAIFNSMAIVA